MDEISCCLLARCSLNRATRSGHRARILGELTPDSLGGSNLADVEFPGRAPLFGLTAHFRELKTLADH